MTAEHDTLERLRAQFSKYGYNDQPTAANAAVQIEILADEVDRGVPYILFFYEEYMAWLGAKHDKADKSDIRWYPQKVRRLEQTFSELDELVSFFRSAYKEQPPADIVRGVRYAETALGKRSLVEGIQKSMGTMGKPHWYWMWQLLKKRLLGELPMALFLLGFLVLIAVLAATSGYFPF